jgi:hypothetical protein
MMVEEGDKGASKRYRGKKLKHPKPEVIRPSEAEACYRLGLAGFVTALWARHPFHMPKAACFTCKYTKSGAVMCIFAGAVVAMRLSLW